MTELANERVVYFNGEIYKTLKYLQLDPGVDPSQLKAITEDVLERNLHLLGEDDDYWVSQRISRGEEVVGGDVHEAAKPLLIVEWGFAAAGPVAPPDAGAVRTSGVVDRLDRLGSLLGR